MQCHKWEMYVVIQEMNLQNKRQKSDYIFVMIYGYPFVVYIRNTDFKYMNKIQNQDSLLR